MSPLGVRCFTVLGEFKPFGLIAEALDGKPADNVTDKYDYFLFDPETVRERDETDDNDASASTLSDRCDHELFIRGNRIIWSTGPQVFKRFTSPSPVITAAEVNSTIHAPSSSSTTLFGVRDLPRPRKESGHSPQHNVNFVTAPDHIGKGETNPVSSHLILKDPLEEPHLAYIEERGKLNLMKEFDEATIWTSDQIPLMASYNTGKMQHSVWVAETSNSNHEMASASLLDPVPAGVLAKQFSFRRIWQGKGAHTAACKVFLATDDDAAPIICFLHQEQKKLMCVRLQSVEINNEIIFEIKPDMSWSIPAVAAAPVIVTRPRGKVGQLPYSDMLVLAPENVLLYSGKHCLCRYMLPSCVSEGRFSHNLEFPETSVTQGLKIIGLADAVEGRFNVLYLKAIRICGPRYWPQIIELIPEDEPWWTSGDKNSPFNSGVVYIKRKVGACSYIDDPIGCQSLLSRAMHKVFGLTSLKGHDSCSSGDNGPGSVTVDQLVGTFSSDPSLLVFAQLCCDPSWKSRSDINFQEFCLQVLFECVSKDRPALLQVYLSLYTTMGSMAGQVTSDTVVLCDSLAICNLKLALAYNETLLSGRSTSSRGGIVRSNFIACLRKQVEEILNCSQDLKDNFCNYMYSGRWPNGETHGDKRSILLSWYLQWFSVPAPSVIKMAVEKVKPKLKSSTTLVPLLHVLFPRTHISAIAAIDKLFSSNKSR